MANKPLFETILCPVDFSEHSREALSYAALVTARNNGRLVVTFVEDPLLVAAARGRLDEKTVIEDERKELRRFVERTITRYGVPWRSVTLDVAVGRPYQEIARTAERLHCDLVVMGAHGRTGANKLLFGSTTHRMLRHSPLPILATPPVGLRAGGPRSGWPGKSAVAPIDLGARARADALAAAVAARDLGTRVELVHIVEPVVQPPWLEVDAERRNNQQLRRAMVWLTRYSDELSWAVAGCRVEPGAPPSKIAEIATNTRTGLVIMTRRRGQGLFGPRQGAISYSFLVQGRTAILALPNGAKWMRQVVSRAPKKEAA
jgi:nucleotide-binding universal stress UspA family protein